MSEELLLPGKIINTAGWRDEWLARMVSWCFGTVGLDPREIALAHFCLAHNSTYRGWANFERRSIRVKINPLAIYPIVDEIRGFPTIAYSDTAELTVMITAHEMAHHRWPDASERATEQRGRDALTLFRRDRSQLMASWGDPGPGPTRPTRVYRIACPGCGLFSLHFRRPRIATIYCKRCFPVEADARAAAVRLLCTRVPTPVWCDGR